MQACERQNKIEISPLNSNIVLCEYLMTQMKDFDVLMTHWTRFIGSPLQISFIYKKTNEKWVIIEAKLQSYGYNLD